MMRSERRSSPAVGSRPEGRSHHPYDARSFQMVLFAIYLALLVWLVLWKLEPPWVGAGALREIVLVPFQPGANTLREVLANVLLFVPFGLYLARVSPAWRWWRSTLVTAAASVALEFGQYVLAVGSSDATDVVANTLGGLIGLGLFSLTRRVLGERADRVMSRMLLIGTVVVLIAVGLFLLSPVRYAPPPDRAGAVSDAASTTMRPG